MIIKFDDFLNESKMVNFDEPDSNFIVMMGAPGAGKTFSVNTFLNLRDFKYINVDTYRENIAKKLGLDISKPEDNLKILDMTYTTSDPRNKTIQFLKQFLTDKISYNKPLPNVVFDAGGSQVDVIKNILELAEYTGYKTTLVYVKTDLELDLIRNRTRERKLTDEMVIDYYNRCENTYDYLKKFYDNVWIIFNNAPYEPTRRNTVIQKVK